MYTVKLERNSIKITVTNDDDIIMNVINNNSFFIEKFIFTETKNNEISAIYSYKRYLLFNGRRKIFINKTKENLEIRKKCSCYYIEFQGDKYQFKYNFLKPSTLHLNDFQIGEIKLKKSGVNYFEKDVSFYKIEYFSFIYIYMIVVIDFFDVD